MGLIDLAINATLGSRRAPDMLTLALFNGRAEVTDAGYRRAEIAKGGWTVRNGQASVAARFGPFAGTTTFDRAVLMRGNEMVESKELTAPATCPQGMIYDHEFVAVWERQP